MTPVPPETVHDLARRLVAAGVSVIPIRADGSKAPKVGEWESYQGRRPTESELRLWFAGRRLGLAAIGGTVSGGLECIDFDEPGLFERWSADVEAARPGLVPELVIVRTPKGGAHAWFRSPACEPNQVLAWRPPSADEAREKPRTKKYKRIETRGAGGYALLPGSPNECHPFGRPYEYANGHSLVDVPTIGAAERDLMLGLARALNTYADQAKAPPPRPATEALTPGDDFDRRGSWQDVLEPHGWKLDAGTWEKGRATRPGKDRGTSATIGECRGPGDVPLLHVFTSDGAPLELDKTYGRFRAYALLNHSDDWKAAAASLAAVGYGGQRALAPPPHSGSGPSRLSIPDAGISAADLMNLSLPAPRYAVEGLLSEGFNVLAGRPKMGKSWLALMIGWAVAGGHNLGGRSCRPGRVLYLGLEDTRRRLQARMQMLGAALGWDPPLHLDFRTAWLRADLGGLGHMAEWLSDHKGDARLVVIDTLAKFRRPGRGNNSYAEDYQAVGEIKELMDRYKCSALAVHHTRKLPAEDPFDEISGTQGGFGAADAAVILDRKRGADDARLFVAGRDVPEMTVPLQLDRTSYRWTLGPAVDGIDTSGRHVSPASNKVEACMAWLKEFLDKWAYPSKEIADASRVAGFSFDALKQAKARLGRDGTGELTNANLGGKDSTEWWSGLGPVAGWTRRPVEVARRTPQPDEPADEPAVRGSESGPDLWPG